MDDTFDQIFVRLKHWLVGFAPEEWRPLLSAVISVVALLAVFPGLFALTTVLERKGLGRIQNRYGPNRVGPYGILQPVARCHRDRRGSDHNGSGSARGPCVPGRWSGRISRGKPRAAPRPKSPPIAAVAIPPARTQPASAST